MAVLKQIKFGSSSTPIAKSVVAINENSTKALSVVATNDQLTDNADPTYTIALAVDGKTITKTGDNGLATALALKVEAASGEGNEAKKARIALVDSNGGSGYAELSSVNIEDIVGKGIVDSASYEPTTGILTINWVGDGENTEINLGALLDIQDIIIKSDSTNYLSFDAVADQSGDAGQAQIGVKLADVTYTATVPGTSEANLTVDTENGKMLDASDAIPAIKNYVDDKVTNLAVQAQGDNYITAAVDTKNNKKINVTADVQSLTATAGTPGVYGDDGSQTTAPTAGTLSGTADSLADGADIAEKVKTYVDGAIAIEAARSDAKNKADIAALDVTDAAMTGQYVSQVSETDGKIAVERTDVSGAPLNNYAKGTQKGSIAATDTINQAFSKIEVNIEENERVTSAALTDLDNRIKAMDKAESAVDGQVVTTVAEADGVVSETKANVKDLQLGGYAKDAKATGAIAATDTINTALSKLENTVTSTTVRYKVDGTTLIVAGVTEDNTLS